MTSASVTTASVTSASVTSASVTSASVTSASVTGASGLEILRIPVLTDNYVWLLRCPVTGQTAVVDPAQAQPVDAALTARGWSLSWILNTHHHWDHTGGNLALKRRHGAKVLGSASDAARIPGIDLGVNDGDRIQVGDSSAAVLFVPAHTAGHSAFYFADSDALFCGDALFLMGCGRLFEGTAAQLWRSMLKLRTLPGQTRVYCAHEYTQSNAAFALSVDPTNAALQARAQEVAALRRQGQPTVPGLLSDELLTNPFVRADRPELAMAMGMPGATPQQVIGELRARKDRF